MSSKDRNLRLRDACAHINDVASRVPFNEERDGVPESYDDEVAASVHKDLGLPFLPSRSP